MPSPGPDHAFRLIVFDFDGTLVDSQFGIAKAMAAAFSAEGLPVPSREAVRRCVGLRLEIVIARLLGEAEVGPRVHGLCERYRAAFHAMRGDDDFFEPVYPRVLEILALLDHPGVQLAIATGKNRRTLGVSLEHHGLAGYFPILKTADDGPGKPHPGILRDALRETGVAATEAVMIGDTSFDMEMARAAGIPALGAGWGYHEDEELRAAGAARILTSMDQLPDCLREMRPAP